MATAVMDMPTTHRGLPRLKHKISSLFARSSHRPAPVSNETKFPTSTATAAADAEETPRSSRVSRLRRPRRSRHDSDRDPLETPSVPQKTELPTLQNLGEIGWQLSVPYLHLGPTSPQHTIDWEKEIGKIRDIGRDSLSPEPTPRYLRNDTRRLSQVVPDLSDDDEIDTQEQKAPNTVSRERPRSTFGQQALQSITAAGDAVKTPIRPKSEFIEPTNGTDVYSATVSNITPALAKTADNSPAIVSETWTTRRNSRISVTSSYLEQPRTAHTSAKPSPQVLQQANFTPTNLIRTESPSDVSRTSSVSGARRKWEVKTDTLLAPVANSQNPAATSVARRVEALNTGNIKALTSEPLHRQRSASRSRRSIAGSKRSSVIIDGPNGIRSDLVSTTSAAGDQLPYADIGTRADVLSDRRQSLASMTTDVPSPILQDASRPDGHRGRSTDKFPTTSRTSPSARRSQSRLSGERLSFIRALEDNNVARPGGEREAVLRKMDGGVASKLAKFEASVAPSPVLARTNSNVSSISVTGTGLTRRTTLETTASNTTVPTSGVSIGGEKTVMTNFDDAFRQKMELLAGSLAGKANKEKDGESTKHHPVNPLTIVKQPLSVGDDQPDAAAREARQAMLSDLKKMNTKGDLAKQKPDMQSEAGGHEQTSPVQPVRVASNGSDHPIIGSDASATAKIHVSDARGMNNVDGLAISGLSGFTPLAAVTVLGNNPIEGTDDSTVVGKTDARTYDAVAASETSLGETAETSYIPPPSSLPKNDIKTATESSAIGNRQPDSQAEQSRTLKESGNEPRSLAQDTAEVSSTAQLAGTNRGLTMLELQSINLALRRGTAPNSSANGSNAASSSSLASG